MKRALSALFSLLLLTTAHAEGEKKVDPMTFTLVGKKTILAKGGITNETPVEFSKFLYKNKVGTGYTLELDSGGGLVFQAMDLGDEIRRRKFDTVVRDGADCYSMCPFLLLAGVHRWVEPEASIGVHQLWIDEAGASIKMYTPAQVEAIQVSLARLAQYVSKMGGTQDILVLATAAKPTAMEYLTYPDLYGTRLITKRPK